MGRPLDSLFAQLLLPTHRGSHSRRSVFSPRRREANSAILGSSHLTLAKPEFLERRAVMDVGAGMSYSTAFGTAAAAGTLGIWIDDSDVNGDLTVDQDVFIRRTLTTRSPLRMRRRSPQPACWPWKGRSNSRQARSSGPA